MRGCRLSLTCRVLNELLHLAIRAAFSAEQIARLRLPTIAAHLASASNLRISSFVFANNLNARINLRDFLQENIGFLSLKIRSPFR